jgi:hypothetical protein
LTLVAMELTIGISFEDLIAKAQHGIIRKAVESKNISDS